MEWTFLERFGLSSLESKTVLLSLLRKRKARKQPILLLENDRNKIRPLKSLVHVGAHLAEERTVYAQQGFQEILWIEGSPETYSRLVSSFDTPSPTGQTNHRFFCALLTDVAGQDVPFYKFNNEGASDSLFQATSQMKQQWPELKQLSEVETLKSQTLDDVVNSQGLAGGVDVLVVDVQGAELLVLKGGTQTLRDAQAVVCEVSTKPFYSGGVLYPELRDFLGSYGFMPTAEPHRSHCDLLFKRRAA